MFDTKRFSQILQQISNTYASTSEFAEKSDVNRTYLSKYINMKLNNPPTPKILEKIAKSSHSIVNYSELMKICGYIIDLTPNSLNYYLDDKQIDSILVLQDTFSLSNDEMLILKSYIIEKRYKR